MLVIIAVHKDGDILGQKTLNINTINFLDERDFGCESKHISHSIDHLDFEVETLDWPSLPEELRKFMDYYWEADFFALDDRWNDPEEDFNEKKWLARAYPEWNKNKESQV